MKFIGRFKLCTVKVYTMIICFEINHNQLDDIDCLVDQSRTSTTYFLMKALNQIF